MPQYEVNTTSVQTLLSWISSREIAIPEIQRPFVWDASKVRDLIDSLYKGFPVGYIIIWRSPDVRTKSGQTAEGRKILIDGQQRITALQAALVGEDVVGSDYKKKRITISFNPKTEKFEVFNSAIAKSGEWIDDISEVYKAEFDQWNFVNEYCQKNPGDDRNWQSHINTVINNLKSIQNNHIGVIELSHQLSIEDVTDIFIRINSQGVVLSQADFVMSKIAADEQYGGNQLRKLIDYFCHLKQKPGALDDIAANDKIFSATDDFTKIKWIAGEHESIYVPSYTDVLRVAYTFKFVRGRLSDLVSLLSGRNFETRLYEECVAEAAFHALREGVGQFVNQTNFKRYLMIVRSTGIITKELINSQNVLNFGYALYLLLCNKGEDPVRTEKIVRRWIVLSILTGRYSGSPESQFEMDIKRFHDGDAMAFLENAEAGELSDAFWEYTFVDRLETSVRSSPMFKVFLMAQVKAGDRGFLSEQIDVKSLIEQRGDIHHIFPKKYLQKNGIDNRGKYNQVANYVYTQSEINIRIKDQAPKEYMRQVCEQCNGGRAVYGGIQSMDDLRKNLAENCIPEEIFDMDYTDYDRFLELRRKLISKKIQAYYESLK